MAGYHTPALAWQKGTGVGTRNLTAGCSGRLPVGERLTSKAVIRRHMTQGEVDVVVQSIK